MTAAAKLQHPCMFQVKGSCNQGIDCLFSHDGVIVATAKLAFEKAKPKGPPPKRQGKAPGGVATLLGAASLLVEPGESCAAKPDVPTEPRPTSFVDKVKAGVGTFLKELQVPRILRTEALITAAAGKRAVSVPANLGTTQFVIERIADSGAGEDLGSLKAFAEQGVPKEFLQQCMNTSSKPVAFDTGGGPQPGTQTCLLYTSPSPRD